MRRWVVMIHCTWYASMDHHTSGHDCDGASRSCAGNKCVPDELKRVDGNLQWRDIVMYLLGLMKLLMREVSNCSVCYGMKGPEEEELLKATDAWLTVDVIGT
jgi:hypothetical protein